jgi:putative ABC transport system permease protein
MSGARARVRRGLGRALDFRLPLRFLRGGVVRVGLTVGALACGVALVCAIDLANAAVLRAFTEVLDAMAGRAALSVGVGERGTFPEELAATIAATPGVVRAVPVVTGRAFVADESGTLVTVQGVDLANDDDVRVYAAHGADGSPIDDPLLFLSQPDSLALTRAFAARRGLAIDDAITLVTPVGTRRFVVRALLEAEGVARVFGGNLVVMDLYAAQLLFTGRGLVNRVDVVVAPDADLGRVHAAVRAVVPAGLAVDTPAQRKADLGRVVRSLQAMLAAVSVVGLLTAFLIAFNRLSTLFERRAWEIGVLRAVGLRPRAVWRELVKESLLLGAAGVSVGLPLGVALGRLLLPAIATATALNFKLVAPSASLGVRASSLALAAALGFATAFLAAALPAARAARISIADTIRRRGVEQPAILPGAAWPVRIAVVGATLGAITLQGVTGTAAFGLAASALVVAVAALAARPLVGALQGPLAGAAALSGPVARFAVAMIADNPRRAALTVGMIGVGVGAVVWLETVATSFERTVVASLAPALRSDLAVGSAHLTAGFIEEAVDDTLLDELSAVPGAGAIAGVRVVDWPYEDGDIALTAWDPSYYSGGAFGSYPLVGERLPDAAQAVARGGAALMSSNFALNLGVRVGDTVVLDSPRGPVPLRIAGTVNDFASPRGTLGISREVYVRFWEDRRITRASVNVAPGAARDALRAEIGRRLGRKYELRILDSRELMDHFATQVRRAFAGLHVLRSLVLVLVLLGMSDTLGAGVVERTREIGTVRALGVRPRHLRRMVVLEAVLLAVLGLALAVPTGVGLGLLWVDATMPHLLGWVLDLHVPWASAAGVAGLVVAACVVAALMPARRAAGLRPAVALRWE